MKLIYNGTRVMVYQIEDDNDMYHIDFVSCYDSNKSVECHKAEIFDVIAEEFNAIEINLKENMKSIKLPREPKIDKSDLDELKKIL